MAIYSKQTSPSTGKTFIYAATNSASALVFYPASSGDNAYNALAWNPTDLGTPLVSSVTACNVTTTWGSSVRFGVYNNGHSVALGTAALSGDANNTRGVSSVTLSYEGYGYPTAPVVTFTGAITGSNVATAVAVVSAYRVRSITITNPGSGYNVAPTVTIAAPPSDPIKFLVVNPASRESNLVTLTFSRANALTGTTVTAQGRDNWTPEFGRKRLLGYF